MMSRRSTRSSTLLLARADVTTQPQTTTRQLRPRRDRITAIDESFDSSPGDATRSRRRLNFAESPSNLTSSQESTPVKTKRPTSRKQKQKCLEDDESGVFSSLDSSYSSDRAAVKRTSVRNQLDSKKKTKKTTPPIVQPPEPPAPVKWVWRQIMPSSEEDTESEPELEPLPISPVPPVRAGKKGRAGGSNRSRKSTSTSTNKPAPVAARKRLRRRSTSVAAKKPKLLDVYIPLQPTTESATLALKPVNEKEDFGMIVSEEVSLPGRSWTGSEETPEERAKREFWEIRLRQNEETKEKYFIHDEEKVSDISDICEDMDVSEGLELLGIS